MCIRDRLWQTAQTFSNPIAADIAVGPNDNIYFIGSNDRLYAYDDNGGSGTELGTFDVGTAGSRNSPVVNAANQVYITDGNGTVFALDGTDPSTWGNSTNLNGVIWKGQMGAGTGGTPALSADGSIAYVGSDDNKLYAWTGPASSFQAPGSLSGIGTGYAQADPAPVVTITGADKGTLEGNATVNPNGTLNVAFSGVPALSLIHI